MDARAGPDVSTLRFLVVEDQGFQRWAVEHMLRSIGAKEVFAAEDGRSALQVLKALDPPVDIIVSDLNMPGMDGIEFIRHVGETGSRVSFMLLSEQDPALIASVATMARAYGVGLLEALQKPLTPEKLNAAIARYHRPGDNERHAAAPRSFSLVEIDAAIRNAEFEPYFQAKVELDTLKIQGAEALARWHHPLHGLVLPASFVAVLESNDKMEGMTTTMLRKAAAACRSWRDAGSAATVSINISLTSLVDVALADRVDDMVRESGLESRDIVLEVTETAAISHLGRVLENLSRLRMKGFGLSIDDYGTGYASMQQLARIPFTELKIDRSFVRNAAHDRSSRAMVESSLEMARKLGISAVAEGVETEEQFRVLRDLGCPAAQGNHIVEPLPAAQFSALLARGGPRR
jgi:EAL domain-containing protein (putative c-di-GMP-specific phosphodiesterase class I)/AmiR/NasT family two-component response regulator